MFNIEWEYDYLFAENFFGNAQCLICERTMIRVRKYYLERHYLLCHNEYKNIINVERKSLLLDLKKKFYEQYILDFEESKIQEGNDCFLKRKASYVVAAGLAKRCRPFEDGTFFKELNNNVLECFGKKGEEMIQIINDIPLSARTISRRTEKISAFIHSNIKNRIISCKYFSICLDECTDINNIAQLIICV